MSAEIVDRLLACANEDAGDPAVCMALADALAEAGAPAKAIQAVAFAARMRARGRVVPGLHIHDRARRLLDAWLASRSSDDE